MSHLVTIETQVRDPVAVSAACARLQLAPPLHRTVRLFSSEATGLAVELPGWRYPLVCDTTQGRVHYDNFNGRWGDPVHLQRFQQRYAAEKTLIEARRAGHVATEHALADGSIRIAIQAG